MRVGIGEKEKGAIYKIGNTSAFFYPLNSSYYCNVMINDYKGAIQCTFEEFKALYPYHIFNNYYSNNIK